MLETLQQQIAATSALEWFAFASAIAYLLLVIRENIACWYFAAASSLAFVALFIEARFYMEALLNCYYVAMAAYGWWTWRRGPSALATRTIERWSWHVHAAAIAAIVLLSALVGFVLQRFSDAALPFFDSLTTFAAFWATFLVARKVFENWWYWLIIDLGSIALYLSRDLVLTSLLFAIYIAMIPFGMRAWRRSLQRQHA